MYKHILLPITQSAFEDDAVAAIEKLAKTFGAKVTVLDIMEILPLLEKDRKAEYEKLKTKSEQYIAPIREKLAGQGIDTSVVVLTGTPSMGICKYVEDTDVDLVVMPVYDRDESSQIIVGTVAERLFKHSSKPVLFVRSGAKDILRGRKILVVDDEPDILDTVEDILDMCEVVKASDYDSAVKLVETNYFDIVVLDIMGVDGFNILKKTVRYAIPTVLLTAHSLSKDSLNKAASQGATAFLPKDKMMELDTFLVDVIRNSGRPVWKSLLERMSSYFHEKMGWTPEDTQRLIENNPEL